jgi:hypothetical protein
MFATKEKEAMASYLTCLSKLENNTALLYNLLSDKTHHPLAKSLLKSIAQDSLKHSTLLKGIGDSISTKEIKEKDCEHNLGKIWNTVATCLKRTSNEEEKQMSLEKLYENLIALESNMGEEYYVLVQTQTLQYLTEEINKLYKINFSDVQRIFETIKNDEERHREILTTLLELSQPEIKDLDNTPLVKFQSPDKWINYSPNSQ